MNYNKIIWKKKRGKDGKIYYYNVTGKTRQYLKGGFDPDPDDEEHEELKKIMNILIDLRCAISSTLILDPVSIGSRKENKPIVYERAAIQAWFDTRRKGGQTLNCPSTRIEIDGIVTSEPNRSREIASFVEKYKDVRFQGPSWDEIREDCAVYLESIQGNPNLLQIQNEAERLRREEERIRREEEEREREQQRLRREEEEREREQQRLRREEEERLDPDRYRLLCTIQEAPPRAMLVLPSPPIEDCPICKEKLSDDVVSLECGHLFHKECFDAWTKNLIDVAQRQRQREVIVKCTVCKKVNTSPPVPVTKPRDRVPAFLQCRELNEIGKDKVLTLLEYLEPFCPIVSMGYLQTKKILTQYPNSKEFLSRLDDIWKNEDISEAYEQNKLLLDTVEKSYWKQRKILSPADRKQIERLREMRILLEYPDIEDFVSCFTDAIGDERHTLVKKPRQLKHPDDFSYIYQDHLEMISSKVPELDFEIEIKRFWDYESERAKEKERKKLKSAASEEEKLQILKTLDELEDFWDRDDRREDRLKQRLIKARSFSDKSLKAFGLEICAYGLPRHAYIQSRRLLEETWKYKSVDEETIKRIKEVLILMQYADRNKTFLEYSEIWEEVHKAEQARLELFLQPKPIFQEELFTRLELVKQRAQEMSKKLLEHQQKLENERKLEKNKKIEEFVSAQLFENEQLTNNKFEIKTLRNANFDLPIKNEQRSQRLDLEMIASLSHIQDETRAKSPRLYNLDKLKARLLELESTASLDDRQSREDEEEKRKLRELISGNQEPKLKTDSCIGGDCDDLQRRSLLLPRPPLTSAPEAERRTYKEELERIRLIPDELIKKDAFERLQERIRQQAEILGQYSDRLQQQREKEQRLAHISTLTPEERRNFLGTELFKLVSNINKQQAGKITGMLLQSGNQSVLALIDTPEELRNKVRECMYLLEKYRKDQRLEHISTLTPEERHNFLGTELFKLVSNINKPQAGKITGMLLQLGTQSVLDLIDRPEELRNKVREAMVVLERQR